MFAWLPTLAAWRIGLTIAAVLSALAASGHAVLYKRDSRGTMLWVGLVWLVPLVGPALYFGFGINRIKRRAILLRRDRQEFRATSAAVGESASVLPPGAGHLTSLAEVVRKVTARGLIAGNRVEALENGDTAYPAMLEAIRSARESVALCTYIFEGDTVGRAFAEALETAVHRGVDVRVLIDATGTLFSWSPVLGPLRRAGVPYARFLPAFSLLHPVSLNLRNHRKLLVVDGREGFTGGMNIMAAHWWAKRPRRPVRDLHFRVLGPVVAHLQEAFADDWFFTTGEALRGDRWFPGLERVGEVVARGIADGPDEDFEKTRWALLAALAVARKSVRIMTPYFLPDTALISALNLAAMRGVETRILLPSNGDVPFVQWASAAHWWQLLEHGCRLWVAPAPFDHSKLCIVDECWVLLGSSNWDPRSLRLNFEFNLECYDERLALDLAARFDARLPDAHEMSLEETNGRSLPVKFRDGIARLLTPFL